MPFLPLQSFLAGAAPEAPESSPEAGLRAKAPVFRPRSRLPAVVSVRKSGSKGCAVVLLRDAEVLERSVLQRVAVVDNVCVEVKRHARKEKDAPEEDAGEATPTTACSSREASPAPDAIVGGVFVAWGHRVERRMPVSEAGLEAYFNGLAGTPMPAGLEVRPPFEEQLQRFPLSSRGPLALNMEPSEDAATASRLLESPHSDKELVQGLWHAKEMLDSLWAKPPPPMGRNLCQRVARDQLFPHSGKEGRDVREREHENRAGEKLAELAAAAGLLDGVRRGAGFLDLCGGPGAWSQFLLAHRALALRGFGFTLRSSVGGAQDWQAEEKDDWYPDLLEQPNWQALWGADGTGDLLKPGNLEHCASKLKQAGGVFLCVADGGFSDQAIPANHLELYFYRLFLAELLTAVSCLQPGGRFICKLYSAYSSQTAGLLFLTTRLFESVAVIKPKSSRVAGPERYLVAFGFRGEANKEVQEIRAALGRSHRAGGGHGVMKIPLLTPVVHPAALATEEEFMKGARSMVNGLCRRQTLALTSITERAELLEDIALEAAAQSAAACPPPGPEAWQTPAEASPSPSRYGAEREHRGRDRREGGREGGRERRERPAQGSPAAAAQRRRGQWETPVQHVALAAPPTSLTSLESWSSLRPQRGGGRQQRRAGAEEWQAPRGAARGKWGKQQSQKPQPEPESWEGLLGFEGASEKTEW